MRKIISFLVFATMLSACNLFIDDEVEETSPYKNVPVHEGEGYDEPVTVEDGQATVTYQMKSDVRRVSDEEADRWVRHVEYDGTTSLIEIHYDANTPAELVPVRGEILLCTNLNVFKWGANHRVLNVTLRGDVYVVVGILASLKDTFSKLDISGGLDLGDTIVHHSEGVFDNETPQQAVARRGLLLDPEPFQFDLSFEDFTLTSTLGLNFIPEYSVSYGVLEGSLELDKDHNYIRTSIGLQFGTEQEPFSLDNMNVSVICAFEEEFNAKFTGKVSLNWTKKFKVGKLFPRFGVIGGVVPWALWAHLELALSAELSASLSVTRSKAVVYKLSANAETGESTGFVECKEPTKVGGRIVTPHNKSWSIGGELPSLDIELKVSVPLTLGFFGKIISMTIEPYYKPLKVVLPLMHTATTDYRLNQNAYRPYDVSTNEELVINGLLGLNLSASLDLSLNALLAMDEDDKTKGNDPNKTNEEKLREKYKIDEELKDATDLTKLKQMVNDHDPSIAEWTEKPSDELELDFSAKVNILDIEIPKGGFKLYGTEIPIFPKVTANTLRTLKWWDSNRQRMTYQAEYAIDSAGLYHSFLGHKLQPALLMLRGSRIVRVYLPNGVHANDKVDTNIKGKTYVFDIDTREDDKEYMICPAYLATYGGYILEPDNPNYIKAMDKPQAYNLTSPSATLTQVEPIDAKAVQNHLWPDVYKGKYPWTVTFNFDTWTHAVGVANMAQFGVKSVGKGFRHVYNEKKDNKNVKDGYYLFHFTKTIYCYQNQLGEVKCNFDMVSFFTVEDEKGRYEYTSDPTSVVFEWDSGIENQAVARIAGPYGDMEYQIPKKRIPYSGNTTKAPRKTPPIVLLDPNKGFIEGDLKLNSITDDQGNVVWQCDE